MKHEAFDLYEGVNMFSSDRITMREKGEVGIVDNLVQNNKKHGGSGKSG